MDHLGPARTGVASGGGGGGWAAAEL